MLSWLGNSQARKEIFFNSSFCKLIGIEPVGFARNKTSRHVWEICKKIPDGSELFVMCRLQRCSRLDPRFVHHVASGCNVCVASPEGWYVSLSWRKVIELENMACKSRFRELVRKRTCQHFNALLSELQPGWINLTVNEPFNLTCKLNLSHSLFRGRFQASDVYFAIDGKTVDSSFSFVLNESHIQLRHPEATPQMNMKHVACFLMPKRTIVDEQWMLVGCKSLRDSVIKKKDSTAKNLNFCRQLFG